jgi:hypothetical protein
MENKIIDTQKETRLEDVLSALKMQKFSNANGWF